VKSSARRKVLAWDPEGWSSSWWAAFAERPHVLVPVHGSCRRPGWEGGQGTGFGREVDGAFSRAGQMSEGTWLSGAVRFQGWAHIRGGFLAGMCVTALSQPGHRTQGIGMGHLLRKFPVTSSCHLTCVQGSCVRDHWTTCQRA
jgi:hypothetical protein